MQTFYIREDMPQAFRELITWENLPNIEGKVFRLFHNRKTLAFTFGEQRYFLKYHRGVGWPEIAKNLSQGKLPILGAKNEWLAIEKLHQLNVPTMNLVAYGQRGWNPASRESFIVTEALEEMESLESFLPRLFQEPPSPKREQIKRACIQKIAWMARTLHQNGINHCDLYICHYLIPQQFDPTNLQLFLIDLHRARIRRHTPKRWVIKDLAAIYFSSMDLPLSQEDRALFIEVYEQGEQRGGPLGKKFWKKVQSRAQKLYQKIHHRPPQLDQ